MLRPLPSLHALLSHPPPLCVRGAHCVPLHQLEALSQQRGPHHLRRLHLPQQLAVERAGHKARGVSLVGGEWGGGAGGVMEREDRDGGVGTEKEGRGGEGK